MKELVLSKQKLKDERKQDEFLRAPWLFKYGPWALLICSLFLCACFLAAANWRISEGRKGVMEATFRLTSTTVALADDSVERAIERLVQANQALKNQPDQNLRDVSLDKLLGFEGSSVSAVALDGQFRPLYKSAAYPHLVTPSLLASLPELGLDDLRFLPADPDHVSAPASLLIASKVMVGGKVIYPLYILDAPLLEGLAKKLQGVQAGWTAIYMANGTSLIDTSQGVAEKHLKAWQADTKVHSEVVGSTEKHLMSVLHSPRGLTIYSGYAETDAFSEFTRRVKATWQIVGFASTFVLMLSLLTGYALVKFERKESYLRRIATIDLLTGLPNRRSFQTLLAKALGPQKSKVEGLVALLFIDLDDFKLVNDTAGHATGDELLRNVANILQGSVREDDRVCRLGGDEFTVIMQGLESVEAAKLAGARILQRLAKPIPCNALEVLPNASVGIAICEPQGATPEEMLRWADTAMYQAKTLGKHQCVVYDEAMTEKVRARANAVKDLLRAINREELFLAYQPKFSTQGDVRTGFEALARWKHPQRGLVSPAEFIPLAEETGLIVDLGNWAMRTAIRQIRLWHDTGHGWLKVAVNVSALQLKDKSLVKCVRDTLTLYQVPGQFLQIELTESSLARDPENVRALMQQLRTLGISIAIDDFGTGYSSLGALQTFEIDWLKVDKSFVNAMGSEQGLAICKAIVVMGQALGMKVIAEGVETLAQKEALKALGCDELQGFLLGKPLPAEAVAETATPRLKSVA